MRSDTHPAHPRIPTCPHCWRLGTTPEAEVRLGFIHHNRCLNGKVFPLPSCSVARPGPMARAQVQLRWPQLNTRGLLDSFHDDTIFESTLTSTTFAVATCNLPTPKLIPPGGFSRAAARAHSTLRCTASPHGPPRVALLKILDSRGPCACISCYLFTSVCDSLCTTASPFSPDSLDY